MAKVSRDDIERIRASGLFDAEWYLEQYPDVKALGMDPAEHYLWIGKRLDRRPVGNRQIEVAVSVVIPIYDRTGVLRVAIESILSQTFSWLELILVTDGSPSETLAVVNEYRSHPKVRIFHFPNNSGNAVRARNKGILEGRGKYIAFLDSDDIAEPNRLELSIQTIERGEADVVYGSWRVLLDGTRQIDGVKNGEIIQSPDCDLSLLKEVCVPCQSTVTCRRALFFDAGFLKPTMRYREDHELWLRFAHFGARFKALPETLSTLRLHSGNNELQFKSNDSYWRTLMMSEYEQKGPMPLKIVFIVPGVGISGGIAVVFRHAQMLCKSGHDVSIINIGPQDEAIWYGQRDFPIIHIDEMRNYHYQNIDLLFGTGWQTEGILETVPAIRKLYFVQSDERRFVDSLELKREIGAGYSKQYEYLTEARWIKDLLREEFGRQCFYVPNGIDTSLFHNRSHYPPREGPRLRVLLEGPIDIPFKGVSEAYMAVEPLDCDLWIVSSSGRPKPGWRCDRFFEKAPLEDMPAIYASCDIFLKMSRIEGFFGPPMEAMACECAVVVGKVTGWDEYIVPGENALVVEQGDVQAARDAVSRLLLDNELRSRLIRSGLETVAEWTWDKSHEAMLNLISKSRVSQVQSYQTSGHQV